MNKKMMMSNNLKNTTMTTEQLTKFFEKKGFIVHLRKQDNVQCAEIEKWTDGGVDMGIWLNPFTVEEFQSYVNDFNVDDLITNYRQDPLYKSNFTISESLKDFTKFHNHLKKINISLIKQSNRKTK